MTHNDNNKQFEKIRRTAERKAALRKQAEDQVRNMEPASLSALTPEDIQRVIQELQVHQIELEMQNEELRTAQAEIDAGRARYFDLYDLAPVGYCTLSEKGLILEANLTAATLLGTTRSVLVNQPISRFILNNDQDIYYLLRKKLFETGEPQECELRLVKPDVAAFWAHLTATAAQAEDGTPLCRVVLSDITGRKRAEEALRQSEDRLSKIMLAANDGMWDWDLKTNEVYYDPHYYRMAGYEVDEFPYQFEEFRKRVHPDDIDNVMLNADQHLKGETGHFYEEFRFKKKNGDWMWIAGRGFIVERDENDTPLRFVGTHQDITERKQADEYIRKLKDELELQVAQKTTELKERVRDLERFHDATIDRELRMKELWDELQKLKAEKE